MAKQRWSSAALAPRSSPEYVRKEVTLEKRLFDALDEGPFVCADPNIVLVPPGPLEQAISRTTYGLLPKRC